MEKVSVEKKIFTKQTFPCFLRSYNAGDNLMELLDYPFSAKKMYTNVPQKMGCKWGAWGVNNQPEMNLNCR